MMSRLADSPRRAWQSLWNVLFRQLKPARRARPVRCSRLGLEYLEDRLAPAVYTVTNTGPPTQDKDSFSLYDVVSIAESTNLFGPSIIHFDSGLNGNVGLGVPQALLMVTISTPSLIG